MVGDEDHPSLLDRRLGVLRGGLHRVPAQRPRLRERLRPRLPPGPYLVVGLARSGSAAALALRARGEEVIGIDAGALDAGTIERLSEAGVEVHVDASGDVFAARARTLGKSPGVPQHVPFRLGDTAAFAPEAAVLLNLSKDHLDRHPSYEDYVGAKLRVFANQGNDDLAVAADDLAVQDLGGCARRVLFGHGPEAELADRAG